MAKLRSTKVSKRIVDALSVENDTDFWDCELPGFGVRVYPSGRKGYIVQTHARGREAKRGEGVRPLSFWSMTSPSTTPSAWPRPASNSRLGAQAIRWITPCASPCAAASDGRGGDRPQATARSARKTRRASVGASALCVCSPAAPKTEASSSRSGVRPRRGAPLRARSSRPGTPDGPCDTAPRYEPPHPPRDRKGFPEWQSLAPPQRDRPAATVVYFCTALCRY